jgi:imidazolonepropionase-like amidohydrolase
VPLEIPYAMRNRMLIVLVLAVFFSSIPAGAQNAPAERGAFRLYKFMQPIGSETYEVARDGDALVLSSTFEFSDRGTKVPLTARLRAGADLTPTRFEIKGKTSRFSSIDTVVEATAGGAAVTENGASRTEPLPDRYFTSAGYAPVAMQQALVRYWLAHGSPAKLRAFPVGEVTISDRGADAIEIDGARVSLRRYSVDGLLWGREWLWLDKAQNLVALVSIDAEFDHFEAVREGYEPALDRFVTLAAADGMAQLADFAKSLGPASPETFAVTGATLIDGTGRPPVPDSVVVVRGDRIVAAGPRSAVKVPAGARTVDGRGKWLMPGLWDMHAHFQQVEWGPIYLAAGVTTVRDCANELEFVTSVRDAIDAGRGLGPRLLLAGIVDGDSPTAIGVVRINSAADAPGVVARYKKAGFRQIKIYSSVKPELVPAIAAEAHKAGLTLTGHVPNGMSATRGVEAGMDQINHLHFVLGEIVPQAQIRAMSPADAAKAMRAVDFDAPEAQKVIKTLAERRTVVDPTVALLEWLWHPQRVPFETIEPGAARLPQALAPAFAGIGVPDDRAEMMAAMHETLLRLVAALHRAGVPIVAGTDQAVPGHSLHREIELYVKAGMTPMEAIQSATIVSARAMGLEKESGTIEAGKVADMLLLNADPLASIANTRKIDRVMTRGRAYEPAPLWRAAGFRP